MHQKNLSEIGESDEQRAIKELPVFGMFTKPYMDWKYGRISGKEAVEGAAIDAAIEGATTVVGGTALKVAGKGIAKTYKFGATKLSGVLSNSKSARMARFGENLKGNHYSFSTSSLESPVIFAT